MTSIKDITLWNALKPLQTIVSFLNTGAHPDDERSDLLAYLTRGLGIHTSVAIANRGEGGQNAIGNETGDALGMLRTEEMRKAAEQLGLHAVHLSKTVQDPIYDHGFEKTAADTFKKWGYTHTYSSLIRVIRELKPDIVMPCFRDDALEHGHHRAMTELTVKAFHDAADNDIFPEHFADGLVPWQIKKLYLPGDEENSTLALEIGEVDPIHGRTYPQLGEQSRFFHSTQGMGVHLETEPRTYHLELVSSIVDHPHDELLTGIAFDFTEFAATFIEDTNLAEQLTELQSMLNESIAVFPNLALVFSKLEKSLILTNQLLKITTSSTLPSLMKDELLHKLEVKKDQLHKALRISADIKVEVILERSIWNRGQESKISLKISNKGPIVFTNIQAALQLPESWNAPATASKQALHPGEDIVIPFNIHVPDNAELHQPYAEPPVIGQIQLHTESISVHWKQPIREIAILPNMSLSLSPEHIIINTSNPHKGIPVTVKVKNYTNVATTAEIKLNLPVGWRLSETNKNVSLAPFEEIEMEILVIPPVKTIEGELNFTAEVLSEGLTWATSIQEINYEHIDTVYHISITSLRATIFSLEKPAGLKIGYVESGFDDVATNLSSAGFAITRLTELDLAARDLSIYDTIVVGIRAYLSRKDLKKHHDKLMEYVKNGGHLVVQYHKPTDGFQDWMPAPYPFKLGTPSLRWRVADESAKVHITKPASPLFSYPNQIKDTDWDHWVQERGLYFPMNWSSQYETVLQVADEDEAAMDSGILLANYGKGTYLYTNLVFYRQIHNQIPGAYRMFSNLLSYGKALQAQQSKKKWIFKKKQQIS